MRYLLFLIGILFVTSSSLEGALARPVQPAVVANDLSREAVENQLGRKLRFRERVALGIVRGKARKQARKQRRQGSDGTVVDGLALTSMILGILAFVGVAFGGFTLLFALGALVLGIVGLGRIKKSYGYRTGKGYAIAGIVLGGAWLVLVLLIISIILLAFN
ncbi:DUF4190 domain-containing protein [Neolewinella aurantiaca]|uniref:DUF4190 domain-containing protein n=1 Tax=Neolewinella aurantiaca TaxID=2602767 RepID=A0A5C7FKC3_9BACT|nr:DUF4190 domain-containing protein [Neolewinella aurantiaca]TXF91779.1 DUF4190 domain-containing protein [Neolewinella aurantiaca]